MIFFAAAAALLSYLSFPNVLFPRGLPFLAWVSIVPLFVLLENPSLSRRLMAGCVFGLVFYALVTQWLIPYSFSGYLLLTIILALQPVLFSFLYRRFPTPILLFYVPALWVAAEFLRALLMSGFSWNTGLSQAFVPPVIQVAGALGSFAVSFVVVLVNAAVYLCWKDARHRTFVLTAGAGAIVLVLGYGYHALGDRPSAVSPGSLSVCAVQPNIDSLEKTDPEKVAGHVRQQAVLSRECLEKGRPDLVIWPETAVSSDFLQDETLKSAVQETVRAAGVPFLIGAALFEGALNRNSAVLLDRSGDVSGIYHKRYLVPFSEYLPGGRLQRIFEILGLRSQSFLAGDKPGLFDLPGHGRFAVTICSEDTIASVFRDESAEDIGWAVVLLNDGWFRQDAGLMMHLQNSVMRAVENRIPVVRVANTGVTCLIDPRGRIVSSLSPNRGDTGVFTVAPGRGRSLYGKIGDVFAVFCLGFVIIIFVLLRGRIEDGRSKREDGKS
ncbi:MAG: apolipoprotein N-acyltransferase [Candidatus Omnitrophota bacterium]|nr:apolipoprotein N-acyltransferase [Candidatus Omnitrophota bacterium]MDZ4242018.1 apolipoprotein N-acyltransferase [Candidatus Omnitrophota bacterium]